RPFIDTRALQPVGRLRRTKQMVEPKPQVPLPAAGGVIPEGVELLLIGVQGAQRIRPALVDDPPPRLPRLRLHHRVVRRRSRREDVAVLRNHVPVAAQHGRPLIAKQFGSVRLQPLHPADLVVEFLRSHGIAVGQVERADDDAAHFRLDIAAMRVVGVPGQADAPQLGRVAPGQDRDSVEALLPVPHRAVARRFDVGDRQRFVGAFELLQRDDVRLLAIEPFDEARQARSDSIEVVGGELHGCVPKPLGAKRNGALSPLLGRRGSAVSAFDYVMTLAAVVIGLALTHLMQGVGRIVEDPKGATIWWVHLLWVAHTGLLSVFWWWFEFGLRRTPVWTFQLYAFVLGYAFLIYLICTILFPSKLGPSRDFREYFLSRRRWFFGLLIALLLVDVVDTLLKGMAHFKSLGLEYPISQAAIVLLCAAGIISRRDRVQALIVILAFGYLVLRVTRFFDVAI